MGALVPKRAGPDLIPVPELAPRSGPIFVGPRKSPTLTEHVVV